MIANETRLFQFFYRLKEIKKQVGMVKQLLPLYEGSMTICSPSTGNITLGLRPRTILPASGEQIVMLPSDKGNNCIICTYMYVDCCGSKRALRGL